MLDEIESAHPRDWDDATSRYLSGLLFVVLSVIICLLIFITLLVRSSLGLIRCTLLLVKGLPSLTENFANLAKGDTRVLIPHILALLVGEEHVRGETTLGGIGVLLLLGITTSLGGALGLGLFRHFEGFLCEIGRVETNSRMRLLR